MLRIELVGHMDAGDRNLWTEDQDLRPLSELGRAQATRFEAAVCGESFDAIYSSPALRCLQTVETIAARNALAVTTLVELRETEGFLGPDGWERSNAAPPLVLGSAFAAGRGLAATRIIQARHSEGRVLVCSHGDILPALLALLRGSEGLDFPAPHERRGGWHTMMIEGPHIEIYQHPVIEDFPV